VALCGLLFACGSSGVAGRDEPSGDCPTTGDCEGDREAMVCIEIESTCNGIDDAAICDCQARLDVKGSCLAFDSALSSCINAGPCKKTCDPTRRNGCYATFCAAHPSDPDCVCVRRVPPA
jgi:hypothetical protein